MNNNKNKIPKLSSDDRYFKSVLGEYWKEPKTEKENKGKKYGNKN